jgi:hypothetical protein
MLKNILRYDLRIFPKEQTLFWKVVQRQMVVGW